MSKIFERVALNKYTIIFHLMVYSMKYHYGFRTYHSTELTALEFTDRIKQGMDTKIIFHYSYFRYI